jgi:hypothetical protein
MALLRTLAMALLKRWAGTIITLIAAILGGGVAGRMTAPASKATVDILFPVSFTAKVGKLNTLSVETELDFKFFTDSKEPYKTCGKDFIFAGTTPMTVWVVSLKDGKLQDPVSCSVALEGPPPPDPKKPDPVIPDPKKPDPVIPVDPIAKAIQTAWQQEFMPSKQTYLPKIIQLYQAMYDKVDSATTYGDVSKTMVDKSAELSLNGVCPVLAGAINAELGKVFPRSPSVLIDKTIAKDTLGKVLAAVKSLT